MTSCGTIGSDSCSVRRQLFLRCMRDFVVYDHSLFLNFFLRHSALSLCQAFARSDPPRKPKVFRVSSHRVSSCEIAAKCVSIPQVLPLREHTEGAHCKENVKNQNNFRASCQCCLQMYGVGMLMPVSPVPSVMMFLCCAISPKSSTCCISGMQLSHASVAFD